MDQGTVPSGRIRYRYERRGGGGRRLHARWHFHHRPGLWRAGLPDRPQARQSAPSAGARHRMSEAALYPDAGPDDVRPMVRTAAASNLGVWVFGAIILIV